MKLQCMCCGIEEEFADGEAAFQAGWDAPPHFTGYVACNLCPAVCVVMGATHHIAHALWAKEGRPKEWTHEKCADDKSIGDAKDKAHLEEFIKRAELLKDKAVKGEITASEFVQSLKKISDDLKEEGKNAVVGDKSN